MPQYTFLNEETNETIDVIMSMKEPHVYIDKDGKEWSRVFYAGQASVDSHYNCWSQQKFLEKTNTPRATMGDIFDRSAELSEKRKQETGHTDPIREAAEKKYSATRKGRRYQKSMSAPDITGALGLG
jgi:hypothetical protein